MATYYVRADGIAANKAAATSDAAAATSMSLTTCNAQTYSPNDTIIISDEGGVYRGTLSTVDDGWSGQPITYQNNVGGTPEIRGSDLVTTWTVFSGDIWEAACTTQPLHVFMDGNFGDKRSGTGDMSNQYDWYWASNVLYIWTGAANDPDTYYTSPGVEAGVRAQAIRFSGHDWNVIDGIKTAHAHYQSIYMYPSADNCTLKNCTAEWCAMDGIASDNENYTVYFENFTIEDCITRYNARFGMLLNTMHHDTTVSRCSMYENGRHYGTQAGSGGFKSWQKNNEVPHTYGLVVEECKVYDNGPVADGGLGQGVGIWYDGVNNDSSNRGKIRRNRVYGNTSVGIFTEHTDYTDVHHNVLYDNCTAAWTGQLTIKAGEGTSDLHSNYNRYYNNVAYGSNAIGALHQSIGSVNCDTSNNEWKNNIISGSATYEIYCTEGGANDGIEGSGNVWSNNCLGAEASSFVRWDSSNCATYDAWETLYGGTTNSIEADPQFMDAASDKLYLKSSSPCVDAGADLGATYDDALDPHCGELAWPDSVLTLDQDSWGSGWEVGAYVHDAINVASITLTAYDATLPNLDLTTINATSNAIALAAYSTSISNSSPLFPAYGVLSVAIVTPPRTTEVK